jgi:hypothetical protein
VGDCGGAAAGFWKGWMTFGGELRGILLRIDNIFMFLE